MLGEMQSGYDPSQDDVGNDHDSAATKNTMAQFEVGAPESTRPRRAELYPTAAEFGEALPDLREEMEKIAERYPPPSYRDRHFRLQSDSVDTVDDIDQIAAVESV